MLLGPLNPGKDVGKFVQDRLMLDRDFISACKALQRMLKDAPTNYNTRFKNLVHGVATSAKERFGN